MATLVRKYGREAFDESCRRLLDHGERLARAAVRAIPNGKYRAEAFLDDDGIAVGKRVPIRVRVEVAGDDMTIDFSDFADQTEGSINTGPAGAVAIARHAFKCLTTPHESPNEGHFRPLRVVAPPGKVISARPPAACGWWSRTTSTTIDCILRAVSDAIPAAVPAAHFGDIPMCLINGYDLRGNRFVFFEPVPGGHGGRPSEDGVSATVCFHEGDTPDVPVEIQEAMLPVFVEESTLDQDSAGPGLHRGGLGYRRTFRLLSSKASIQLNVDRHYCPPWGLHGGAAARPNSAYIEAPNGGKRELVLKRDGINLEAGARVILCGGGGGGWGDPLRRAPDLVLQDVIAGYVSREAARADYGVEVDPGLRSSTRIRQAEGDVQ